MAIEIAALNDDGTVQVRHPERGHVGALALDRIVFPTPIGKTEPDTRVLVVPCPDLNCATSSIYPIGGGSDPDMGQRLFARKLSREAPNHVRGKFRTWEDVRNYMTEQIVAMDGPDRRIVLEEMDSNNL